MFSRPAPLVKSTIETQSTSELAPRSLKCHARVPYCAQYLINSIESRTRYLKRIF